MSETKKPMGAPRKDPDIVRSERLHDRLTKGEKKALEQQLKVMRSSQEEVR